MIVCKMGSFSKKFFGIPSFFSARVTPDPDGLDVEDLVAAGAAADYSVRFVAVTVGLEAMENPLHPATGCYLGFGY